MALFVVQAKGTDTRSLEKAHFIPQGFSWPAFAFAHLWLLYHRLWLTLAIWVALEIAYFVLIASHVAPAASVFVDLLAHFYIGLEGNALRVKRYAAINELVEARDRTEAESIFFRRHFPVTAAS